jgi:DNA polymerase-3 subunit delta
MTSGPSAKDRSIYVLHGRDEHLKEENRNSIVAQITGDADPQLCLRTFDGDVELLTVLDELRTLPFLAPHRVVIVRGADEFVSKNREGLEKYLDNPSQSGTLVLEVKTWNKQTRLAKNLPAAGGEAIACTPPEGNELVSWIRKQAEAFGKRLRPDAAVALAGSVGGDLCALKTELEKLASFTGEEQTITANDVAAVVSAAAPPEAFAVIDAVILGDAGGAIKHLEAALTVRGAEFQVMGQLAWHVRRCIVARRIMDRGGTAFEAVKAAKVWKLKEEFGRMIRKKPMKKLLGHMRNLMEADLGMKSGLDPRDSLQRLLVILCG